MQMQLSLIKRAGIPSAAGIYTFYTVIEMHDYVNHDILD